MLWLVPILPMLLAPLVRAVPAKRSVLASASASVVTATALLAAAAIAGEWTGRYAVAPGIELAAALDPVASAMVLLVPLVALPVVVYAAAHEEERGLPRLLAGLLLFVGSMELLVVAADLVTLLVAWEAVGACSWALILHPGLDRDHARSATRAFLVTRLGDLGLFLAAAAAFAGAGTFAYDALGTLDPEALSLVAAGLVVAAAAKSAQLPFAPWLFAAMAGPTSVSALLHAATMVAAGVFVLARLEAELSAVSWFAPLVLAVGCTTAIAGGVVAAVQSHAKKLLAASTSAHYGLMWTAVGSGFPAVAILHLVAHAFVKATLFLAGGVAVAGRGTESLSRLRVGAEVPAVAAASALAAAALAGIPPLGAAWTKEAVTGAAAHHATWSGIAVAVAGGLSAAYALRFQMLAFGRGKGVLERPPSRAEQGAVLAIAAAVAVLSLLWWPHASDLFAGAVGGRVPAFRFADLAMSLGLVVVGFYAGRAMLAAERWAVAEWFGLPIAGRRAIEEPLYGLARSFARFDDLVLEAPPRLARRFASAGASALGRGDSRVVDAGVRAAARIGSILAGLLARPGERFADGLPEGISRIVDLAGSDARRTQTGLSHHYYAAITAALAVILAALAAGA